MPTKTKDTIDSRQQYFIDKAKLVGRTIKSIRYITPNELENMGWSKAGPVLVLDNGVEVFVQCDDEANDSGVLVAFNPKDGKEAILPSF